MNEIEGKLFVLRYLEHTSNGDKIMKQKKRLSASKKATEITPAQHALEQREKNKLRVKFGYLIIESEESQCSWYPRIMSNCA